ncbi:sensor histidine kinase [Tautonia sociabilis]|uniref:histidine kinase n=1 Tax=Tautonia sociabilis TaxID=2080755 RepID=A0A432MMD5_9BACT|nr:HAMP domain-containing sensor histidine kinase [Tautonia sociabilis]RUL88450.1 HAMP domain-containing histidine kinase [Tautonia sociabilis]
MAKHVPSTYGPDRERQLAHLASSVGHHIINAFSAVVSNAEILLLSSPSDADGELASMVDVIVNVSVKASGVARRLIDFTRQSTKPVEELVDLGGIIREVVSELGKAHPQVSWSVDCRALTPMSGDPEQLRPMFAYLLLNAIEALPAGGGRIAIRGLVEQPEWTTLLIEDEGAGMDAIVQEQALEPFFTTKPGRLGIGLCLANSIWRRHGGTLAISSQPGRGTTLRLTYRRVS